MKALSRMVSACAVLAASGVSLAGDCQCQNRATTTNTTVAASPQRYAYRSGYSYSAPAPAPVMNYYSGPSSVYSTSRPIHGPENQWAFMRARQHVRGW
ncbi:MAG TPA: hypothetical protein VM510_00420 [Caulifigura sp.]|jgi:hypothetical protein|nr:hypothetical protein [Caulifigura sp.]